jgi:hypothetical protein
VLRRHTSVFNFKYLALSFFVVLVFEPLLLSCKLPLFGREPSGAIHFVK